jgi:hypothetical protein
MRRTLKLVILLPFVLLFILSCGLKPVATGRILRVEYLNGAYATSSKTVIYFTNGYSYAISGMHPAMVGDSVVLYGGGILIGDSIAVIRKR